MKKNKKTSSLKLSFQLATLCMAFSMINQFVDFLICTWNVHISFWYAILMHASIGFVVRCTTFEVYCTHPGDWAFDIFTLWVVWAMIIWGLLGIKRLVLDKKH